MSAVLDLDKIFAAYKFRFVAIHPVTHKFMVGGNSMDFVTRFARATGETHLILDREQPIYFSI